jgi:branched-chain amino acid transport system substrate-binding protein
MSINVEYSQEMIDAANLAVSEINANGKVLGKELKVFTKDDAGDKTLSDDRARELIAEDTVVVLISGSSSRCLSIFNDAAKAASVVVISPTASSPEITSLVDNNLFWRTMPSDAFQGRVAANYVKNTLNKSDVGIFYMNDSYGAGLASEFNSNFTTLGGNVVAIVSFEEQANYDSYDFKPDLDQLFANQPSVIYLITIGEEGRKITTSIYTGNYFTETYKPILMGCDGNKKDDFLINSPAEIVEGMYGVYPTGGLDATFDTNFSSYVTGTYTPSAIAKHVYDEIYLIAYAILAANSEDPNVYKNFLREVSVGGEVIGINQFADTKVKIEAGTDIDYNGASGKIDFDENGDVTSGTYEIWKIENGAFVTVTTIDFP